MNAYQRVQRRLAGEPVDRPPNFDIFMTFAAHYIGQPLSSYYLDHQVLVEANLAMVEDFGIDILQAISDPYREAVDFGAEVAFPEDGLPQSQQPLLADPADLQTLRRPDPTTGRRMSDRLQALRRMRDFAGDEIPVMGWVEGSLAEAADLRGVTNTLLDTYERPEWLLELLERCVEVGIDFARAQVEAGAHIIGLGDSIASQISPKMYRKFALPYEQRIFEAVHEAGALARLHICGDVTRILPDMVQSGADIIDLDWMVDMEAAAEAYGDRLSLCGNFDPVTVMLQGTPQEVYEATLRCMRAGGPRSFSAAGCEIPDGTPHENLRAQQRALQDLGAEA
ncbi:MAG: uroporphyrinogen decarboxylase family protein [Anaerolineales bacterium]